LDALDRYEFDGRELAIVLAKDRRKTPEEMRHIDHREGSGGRGGGGGGFPRGGGGGGRYERRGRSRSHSPHDRYVS
jgi:hypothetical protein